MKILRKCSSCGLEAITEEDLDLFRKRKSCKHGRQNICKVCDSDRHNLYLDKNKDRIKDSYYQRTYNISLEEVKRLLNKQNNKCAICDSTGKHFERNFHIDHDHKTKEVRGILCHSCNVALGHFKDNINVMLNAIKYLGESHDRN